MAAISLYRYLAGLELDLDDIGEADTGNHSSCLPHSLKARGILEAKKSPLIHSGIMLRSLVFPQQVLRKLTPLVAQPFSLANTT